MSIWNRREALSGFAAATAALVTSGNRLASDLFAAGGADKSGPLTIAPFRFDVTPPAGHSCCGGWIKPIVGVDDAQEAIGFVLSGAGKP
ncbi:MAG TPA: hypothetical protein PLV92_09055, partial [Pirellulaceae bacterium]|nr:hypothetical protein [Pirellulaceae bacterium]